MGVRENKVEKYLNSEIDKMGGITRKWVSPGRDGVPDRIIIVDGTIDLVEVKTNDGKLSPSQIREQVRLSNAGATVATVYGKNGVDEYVKTKRFSQLPAGRILSYGKKF